VSDNGEQPDKAQPEKAKRKAAPPVLGDRRPLLVVEPVLLRAADAARLCGFADRTWRKMAAAGRVPAGVQLGKSRRWALAELRAWVAAGCPCRDRWDDMKTTPADALQTSAGEC
jgi:predicted DNA-binding transcriptional regulator AlpA